MMTTLSIEEISRRLSHTLDCLGYCQQMVQLRKNFYNSYDLYQNSKRKIYTIKTAGSRGEGMIKMSESDWDVLFILHTVLVIEAEFANERTPELASVYTMVPCLTHPGHFKLLLLRQSTFDLYRLSKHYLTTFENNSWLSSKQFMFTEKGGGSTRSGPAFTRKNYLQFDSVVSLRCVCPRIIQKWILRPRQYNWPSVELIERISYMPANIVATGQKGCPDEEIEWRLCFNEIELILVDSWNDTQRKLYKVLKMIKKNVFVSKGFGISSYMMKNIVMWLSEAYPQSNFNSEYLMSWIIKSLRLLKKAVKVYNLPYYMIPERNLMSEKIPRSQCKSLTREISDLIYSGPQLLWECKRLEFAMSMTPNELLYYKDRCDRIEVLSMVGWIQDCYGFNIDKYKNEMAAIVINSQWPLAVTEMLKGKTDSKEIFQALLE